MYPVTVRTNSTLTTEISIRNHSLITDEPLENGGVDAGPTPMELFVSSLGACMAITAEMYAQRKKWPLQRVTIELGYERFKKEDYPAYTGEAGFVNEMRYTIKLEGPLTEEQQARILEIAQRCPVHRALEYPTVFVHEPTERTVTKAL
jgi:putative redox protein